MTKVVQLSDDAYRRLKTLKRGNESFSDVVLRLTMPGDPRGLRGLRTKEEIETARRMIAAIDELDRAQVPRGRP